MDMYLIIIDSYSKWVEIKEMSDIKSDAQLSKLSENISALGGFLYH